MSNAKCKHSEYTMRTPCDCNPDCICFTRVNACRPVVPMSVKPDLINKPSHYQASNGIETWDVINGFGLGYERGNAVKYLTRAGRKDGIDALTDLLKAKKYIERAIKRLESGEDIKNV